MEAACKVSNVHEVVMNASLLYESTLGVGYEVVNVWAKPRCKHLGDNLGNGMDEANGPEISDVFCPILLGQKHNISGVEPLEVVYM